MLLHLCQYPEKEHYQYSEQMAELQGSERLGIINSEDCDLV